MQRFEDDAATRVGALGNGKILSRGGSACTVSPQHCYPCIAFESLLSTSLGVILFVLLFQLMLA